MIPIESCHLRIFRSRYQPFLGIDFPRIPIGNNVPQDHALAKLGARLGELHRLDGVSSISDWALYTSSWPNSTVEAAFPKPTLQEVDETGCGRIYINPCNFFDAIHEEVWDFQIGRYPVCHKCLKDQKGRTLSAEDISHYGKIIVALRETIRLMDETDDVIVAPGGFALPGS